MTRADIEEMLTNLAATTRQLQASAFLMRSTAAHMVAVSDQLRELVLSTDAAITTTLIRLHDTDEEKG